jgi:hypothetical protein
MVEFNRSIVTAEEECESIINISISNAVSGNIEKALSVLDGIYLPEYKIYAFVELLRVSVIRKDSDNLGLILTHFNQLDLLSIKEQPIYLELVSWLYALKNIQNQPSKLYISA